MTIASGTCGTCHWEISDAGVLTIGAGALAPNTGESLSHWPWYRYRSQITSAVIQPTVTCAGSAACMFNGCDALETIDVSGFDTSAVTSMFLMFSQCSSLNALDLSGFDTSNVVDMGSMFSHCSALKTLNISNFNMSNVEKTYHMFTMCTSLTSLDVSRWDMSSVDEAFYMFYSCTSLATLDVSSWDTSNITDVGNMFQYCSSWTGCDFPAMRDFSDILYYENMFAGCTAAEIYIVPSGSATAAFWRDVASQYGGVHYYTDDATPPTSSLVVTRCDSSGNADDEGTYAKLQVADVAYSTLIPYSLRPNAVTIRSVTLDGTAITPAFVNNVAIVSIGDLQEHAFTYRVTDRTGQTSPVYAQTIPGYDPALDFYHDSSGNGAAFGKIATQANLLDVAWDVAVHGREVLPIYEYATKPAEASLPVSPCLVATDDGELWLAVPDQS